MASSVPRGNRPTESEWERWGRACEILKAVAAANAAEGREATKLRSSVAEMARRLGGISESRGPAAGSDIVDGITAGLVELVADLKRPLPGQSFAEESLLAWSMYVEGMAQVDVANTIGQAANGWIRYDWNKDQQGRKVTCRDRMWLSSRRNVTGGAAAGITELVELVERVAGLPAASSPQQESADLGSSAPPDIDPAGEAISREIDQFMREQVTELGDAVTGEELSFRVCQSYGLGAFSDGEIAAALDRLVESGVQLQKRERNVPPRLK